MNESVFTPQKSHSTSVIKTPLILLGFTFILIGLGITLGIVYTAYLAFTQPDQFSTFLAFANTEKETFIKWVINDNADSIEFSRVVSLIFIAVAASIIIRVTIAFITMCISSGKGLLNLSQNFNE